MDLLSLFTTWLTVFSLAFVFLPMLQVAEWRRRGSADGFSSVNLVLPVLTMACWLKHGVMTNDKTNQLINGVNLVFFTFYIAAFWKFASKRRYLIGQLVSLAAAVYSIFSYVESQESSRAADVMGSIAAAMQIVGLGGGLYEIYRVITLKHTEYLPAALQFAFFFLTSQWLLFGVLTGNYYIAVANLAGLVVNIITLSLFIVYPPLTWRVPIFGTGPQQKKKD